MKLEGVVEIAAPRELVWQTAFDPKVMARVIPGVRTLEMTAPDEFHAQMRVGVGALTGTFTSTLKLNELRPPSFAKLTIQGRGSIGQFSGSGIVHLEDHDAKTLINYHSDIQLGGPMAGLGEGLMITITNTLINQAAKVFTKICSEQGSEAKP